ncbi:MAG TPA: glycosyltransferase family 39 protein [Thermoleophilaceae bacterium]|nr:glycosyltransferase family 39 protein [Thermoleophilaceae bacterium]
MASVASRPTAFRRMPSFPTGRGAVILPAAILFFLVVVSLFLRTRALGDSLWMDEGLSIGIASQPFWHIPTTLQVDGSPPLYYMLLAVWMKIFGDGPGETQGLSVLIAVAAVPAGMWAGWSLFGRRAGLICAALCAVNPFLTTYAQETRMYSLMLLLSLITTALFLHVFAFGRRNYLPAFAIGLALMLYTHNWGLFLAAAAVVALYPTWRASADRKALRRDVLLGFGGAFLLYLPWIPTLIHQALHTGAPWLDPPRFGAPVQISKSLLGGGTPTVALLLAGGSGIAAILTKRVEDKERLAIITAGTLCIATLAIAWLVSQVSPAWTTRYLGVVLGQLLLIGALGLARAGYLGLVAFVIVIGVWSIPKTYGLKNKSNADDLGRAVKQRNLLHRGDLVLSMQPEQTPLLRYNLPGGLIYGTPLGRVHNPSVMNWTDGQDRLIAATPAKNLEPLLARLPRSGRVLIVHPVTTDASDWDAPWTQLVRRRAAQWGAVLASDKHFRKVGVVPQFYRRATRIGVRGVLYEKITSG